MVYAAKKESEGLLALFVVVGFPEPCASAIVSVRLPSPVPSCGRRLCKDSCKGRINTPVLSTTANILFDFTHFFDIIKGGGFMMTYTAYDPETLEQWCSDKTNFQLFDSALQDYLQIFSDQFHAKSQKKVFFYSYQRILQPIGP